MLLCCSCGQSQTGSFLEGGAPNGLFGLGMEDISVPSTLARNGLASNSLIIWGESLLEIMAAQTKKKHHSISGNHSKLSLLDIENADGKVCLVSQKDYL